MTKTTRTILINYLEAQIQNLEELQDIDPEAVAEDLQALINEQD